MGRMKNPAVKCPGCGQVYFRVNLPNSLTGIIECSCGTSFHKDHISRNCLVVAFFVWAGCVAGMAMFLTRIYEWQAFNCSGLFLTVIVCEVNGP